MQSTHTLRLSPSLYSTTSMLQFILCRLLHCCHGKLVFTKTFCQWITIVSRCHWAEDIRENGKIRHNISNQKAINVSSAVLFSLPLFRSFDIIIALNCILLLTNTVNRSIIATKEVESRGIYTRIAIYLLLLLFSGRIAILRTAWFFIQHWVIHSQAALPF